MCCCLIFVSKEQSASRTWQPGSASTLRQVNYPRKMVNWSPRKQKSVQKSKSRPFKKIRFSMNNQINWCLMQISCLMGTHPNQMYINRNQTKNMTSKTTDINLDSWNLCLGLKHKKDYVSKILRENKIDICCLQEIDLEPDYLTKLLGDTYW